MQELKDQRITAEPYLWIDEKLHHAFDRTSSLHPQYYILHYDFAGCQLIAYLVDPGIYRN